MLSTIRLETTLEDWSGENWDRCELALAVWSCHPARLATLTHWPLNHINMNMIRGKRGPRLKAKAAESRHLLPCLEFVLNFFLPPKNDHEERRLRLVSEMVAMYDALAVWDSRPGYGTVVGMHARKAMVLYSELWRESLETNGWAQDGFMVWRLYPKMHLLIHIVEDQLKVNGSPRDCWCYMDESEIGAAVRVAESLHPSTISKTVIQKHRCGIMI